MSKIIDLSKILSQEEIITTATSTSMMHDLSHRLRVLILASAITSRVHKKTNIKIIAYSALYHDISRKSDFDPVTHGQKSAEWIMENLPYYHPELHPGELEKIAYLCKYHSLEDKESPRMTTELRILKDADALDRVRFKFSSKLDPKYLRQKESFEIYKEDLPKKLLKHIRQIKIIKNPERIYNNLLQTVTNFNLPVKLPQSDSYSTNFPTLFKEIVRIKKGSFQKNKSTVFNEKQVSLIQLFYEIKSKQDEITVLRKKLIQEAFQETRSRNTNQKIKRLNKNIKEDQTRLDKQLMKDNGNIVSKLRILVKQYPLFKELKVLHRYFLNRLFKLCPIDKNFLIEKLEMNPNISREKITANNYLHLSKISLHSKLIQLNCHFPKVKKTTIKTLLYSITKKDLINQSIRIEFYKFCKNAITFKLLTKKSKKRIITLLTKIINNPVQKAFFGEKPRILRPSFNPYTNYFPDQQDEYRIEVDLVSNIAFYLFRSEETFLDNYIFPFLLNRKFGNIKLLRLFASKIQSSQLLSKWKFLINQENKNRKLNEPYHKTLLAYYHKYSEHNFQEIKKKLNVKTPKQYPDADYFLCINIQSKNLSKMIHGEKKFFSSWNTFEEKYKGPIERQFVDIVFNSTLWNNYKEISTNIRQPNRSYEQVIYGYLSQNYKDNSVFAAKYTDRLNRLFIRVYGDVTIILKKQVSKRTVFTLLDTLFIYRKYPLLFKEAKKVKYFLDRHLTKIHLKQKMLDLNMAYVEAKYFGGISVKDFDTIIVPWVSYLLHQNTFKKISKEHPKIKIKKRFPWQIFSKL